MAYENLLSNLDITDESIEGCERSGVEGTITCRNRDCWCRCGCSGTQGSGSNPCCSGTQGSGSNPCCSDTQGTTTGSRHSRCCNRKCCHWCCCCRCCCWCCCCRR